MVNSQKKTYKSIEFKERHVDICNQGTVAHVFWVHFKSAQPHKNVKPLHNLYTLSILNMVNMVFTWVNRWGARVRQQIHVGLRVYFMIS